MKAISSSETSTIAKARQRNIPEDAIPQKKKSLILSGLETITFMLVA
jgi:hypothetical protein